MTVIAGYRTIRRLGSGERSEVWLGRPLPTDGESPTDAASQDAAVPDAENALVAIKVFRDEVAAASVDAELRALSRLEHPHVVPVLDVTSTAALSACFVMPRYEPGGLVRLLSLRPHLELGEIVTLVAPLCSAVDDMHSNLVCHGNIGAEAVLLTHDGAPILAGFGSASVKEGTIPATLNSLAAESGFQLDRQALAELTQGLFRRLHSPRAAAGLEGWLTRQKFDGPNFLVELSDRLFELAEPRAVTYAARSVDETDDGLRKAVLPRRQRERRATGQATFAEGTISAAVGSDGASARDYFGLRSWGMPVPIVDAVGTAVDVVRSVGRRCVTELAAVRRRYVVLGGLAILLITATFGVLVANPTAPELGPGSGRPAGEQATSEESSQVSPEPSPTGDTPELLSALTEAESAVILAGDDPVAAGMELLAVRKRCIESESVACLEGVVHPESPVMLSDSELIMARQRDDVVGDEPQSSPWVPVAGLEIGDRMGAAVLLRARVEALPTSETAAERTLVEESEPASLLIIRSEAGWRIRDIYEP